jgi:hypothetical protein
MTWPADSVLEERFQESMPPEADGACPPAELLWSAAIGDLSVRDLSTLSSHLASCGVCGQGLSLSAEFAMQDEIRLPTGLRLLDRWRPPLRTTAVVALPALGVLVLTVLLTSALPVQISARPVGVASRGGADRAGIRSLSGEEQPAAELRLEWTPVDRAVRYRVRVSSDDLQPLYDRTVEKGTSLRLPPAVGERASNHPAIGGSEGAGRGLLHWQVEGILPDGRIVTSPTFTVRVVPAAPGSRR